VERNQAAGFRLGEGVSASSEVVDPERLRRTRNGAR
jgi:hypothetical protein